MESQCHPGCPTPGLGPGFQAHQGGGKESRVQGRAAHEEGFPPAVAMGTESPKPPGPVTDGKVFHLGTWGRSGNFLLPPGPRKIIALVSK